jgi:hypothetical protein
VNQGRIDSSSSDHALANYYAHGDAENPAGYRLGMWIFSVLGLLGVLFAFLLRQREMGPSGHGLETITTAKGAA